MALAHYDPNAIVKRRDPHEPPPRVWSEEERANFRKSGFYKKLQEHALVVHDYQTQRDDARTRSDPEFAPRDDDFDADPVKPFDASVNYYKILGVDDLATAADIRRAWKKLVLVYHPDKIKQSGTDMSEKKARETFERISLSFEVLTDRPTRRQYDRARDGDRANGEVFDWAKKKRKKKDWVPPPVFGSAAEPSKKPKKVPGKPRDTTVVVDFNALDAGCVRKFAVKRRYLNKEKKMTSSTKEYAIPVRPGEMSAKRWVFEGEGDSDAATLAGPVRFFLAIKPHATLIRKGCHCTSDAVVDVVAGRRFFALVETVSGRAVALCGTQGRKRVIQRRFNVSVPRARVSRKAPTLRERSER
jgi:DnaJ-class molecular chaperone